MRVPLPSGSFFMTRGILPLPPRPRRWRTRLVRGCARAWLWLLVCLLAPALGGATEPQPFALASGSLHAVLREFSKTTGLEIIYRVEDLRRRRSPGVTGRFTPREALTRALRGTGLEAVEDAPSGAFVIRLEAEPTAAAAMTEPPAPRDVATTQAPPAGRLIPGTDIFELSPFEVRNRGDEGYRAADAVTATRIAVPSEQLPVNVDTFTREFIEDQHAYDLYDIVKWAPGVHQDNASPQGWVRYNLRGFTRAAVQRNGFGAYRFIDTSNIERVEVVKGPASLLYGQINPGGVINYITKRPEATPRAELYGAGGTQGYARAMLDLTGPLSAGAPDLCGRLVAMTEQLPQFRRRSTGEKHLWAPSVTWRISTDANLTIDYEHFERLDNMPTSGVILRWVDHLPTLPYGPLPGNFSYAGEGDYQDFISDALTAEFTWRLHENLNLQVTYLDSSWDMTWRATGQGATGLIDQSAIDYYYPSSVGLTPADAMYRRNRWEHQWGGERSGQIDLVGDFSVAGADLRVLLGAKQNFATDYHAQQRNNPTVPGSPYYLKPWDLRDPTTWDQTVPFGWDKLIPVADSENESDAMSLHAVVTATSPGRRTRLLAGFARHELHNDPTINHLSGLITAPSNRAANVPQIGVTHALTAGITAFASYSESFLANSNLLLVDNVPTVPAEPSIGRGVEAGIKVDLWNGRFSGTLSLYGIRAKPTDVIPVTSGVAPDGTTLFTELQGGSQRSRGAEIDVLLVPSDALQIMAAYSRCDAVYAVHPTKPEFDGTPLVATPGHTFSVWAKFAPREGPWTGLILAGGLNHVGSFSHLALNPLLRLPAYTTADATVGYQFTALGHPQKVELAVKNLADARYYASTSSWGFPRQWICSFSTAF